MTRKDFEQLARALRERYPHNEPDKQHGYDAAINAVAAACYRDNPRFNRDRWVVAIKEIDHESE
jgi:hypothetical protein